jgi:hypothetical protein
MSHDEGDNEGSKVRLSLLLNCEGEREKEEVEEEQLPDEQLPDELPITCDDEMVDIYQAATDEDRLSMAQIYQFRDDFEFSASTEEVLGLSSSSSDNFSMDYQSSSPALAGGRPTGIDNGSVEDRVPLVCKEGLSEEEIVWYFSYLVITAFQKLISSFCTYLVDTPGCGEWLMKSDCARS